MHESAKQGWVLDDCLRTWFKKIYFKKFDGRVTENRCKSDYCPSE